ncbi:DUF3992 domain-containing protein [Paenibacillus nasutitermitis]|uniref:Endospore appendages core domain-containing protein n=1 Tax=Paenibacillus nasutitermitis TaxID=1652958 RepID=A0A916YV66_9BACL|nr:S-Ena type endospore appendage [Paenibacillus nasutitermitis]GGD62946.1 hypothetical protein GCM10010911_20900 [Paenibacillus nasutitermitis]
MSGCSCNKGSKDDCCFTCCKEEHMVQDKICSSFVIATGTAARTIFTSVGVDARNFFASGTITYGDGTGTISVQFLLGTTLSGPAILVDPGSTLSFTKTNFNSIQITAASATAETPAQGELCLTPRYRV